MAEDNSPATLPIAPLNGELLVLQEDETAFFKGQTGIQNDEELKRHILEVQKDSYEIYPYPCIRMFAFTTLRISRLPAYPRLLKLGKERKGAIFLDLGCCFGNDVRKAVSDGFPVSGAIASDLRRGFWDSGHKLFNSMLNSFPVPFVAGDIFDPEHINPSPPFYSAPSTPTPVLSNITSLTPLQGHVSAIHTSAFFHLFTEEQQLQAARQVASLLSPEPGSVIFGQHAGLPEKGLRAPQKTLGGQGTRRMFCHCPQTWAEMWNEVFEQGTIKVEAELEKAVRRRPENKDEHFDDVMHHHYWLNWSVTRL